MKHSTMIRNIAKQEWKLIAVHWKEKTDIPVFVKVRELSDLQIQAIGNFSLIDRGPSSPTTDWRDIANTSKLQSNIVKAALVSPTYDELCEIAGLGSFSKQAEQKYKEAEIEIESLPRGPVRSGYEKQLASMRILFESILPNTFVAEICEYVLGINRTNIKLVTDEIILNAAILQYQSKSGRICDYIEDKTLSAFNKRDIDTRGIELFNDWVKQAKRQKGKK